MSSRSEAEMSEAVRQCVLECLHAEDARRCIEDFTRRLVNGGWLQADADEVADSAIQVLQTVRPHFAPERDEAI
jgi:hypothetical protein